MYMKFPNYTQTNKNYFKIYRGSVVIIFHTYRLLIFS